MAYADKHQPDDRTPQQLAEAIFNHPLWPGDGEDAPPWTFGEWILMRNEKLTSHDYPLMEALKCLMSGYDTTSRPRNSISHAREVIGKHREDFISSRRIETMHANPAAVDDEIDRELAFLMGHTEDLQKDSQETAGAMAIAIDNLNKIEVLVRMLATKLGIDLIEPGKGKA